MLVKDSNESATNLSVPHHTSPDTQNTGGSTANGLYTTRDLTKLRFKKTSRPDGPAEERPAKRVKLGTEISQPSHPADSNEGGVVNGSEVGQNQPTGVSATPSPKKRGRPPKVKSEDQILEGIPNGQAKDTPTKKARAAKVKPDGQIPNGEKDTMSKKTKVPKPRVQKTEEGPVKEKLTKKEKIAKSKELAKLEPKWTVVAPLPDAEPQASSRNLDLDLVQTKHRPRIWMSNREESLSVMPEMLGSKCFNGVSWELYETPTLVFDEFNTAFRVVCKNGDPRFIDLMTTRKFVSPLQRREPELQRQEVIPAPEQVQFTPLVVDPKPAEYLAKMEPNLYRMPSADPEPETEAVSDTLTTQFTMRQRRHTSYQRTNALVPETAFSFTRTNFSAPLPMYNVNDSVDSLIAGPSSWVEPSWRPNGTLPSGPPIANVAIRQSSEVDIKPVVNSDKELALASENVEPSVTPAAPIYVSTLNDTTKTLGKSAPDAKKRRKEKAKSDGPRRSSGRLKKLESSVQDPNTMAQPDSMPLVQSSCDPNEPSARDESDVLHVPTRADNDLETRTNSNLVSPEVPNGLPIQAISAPTSHVATALSNAEKEDVMNEKETQNGIHGADDSSMQAVVKAEPQSENPLYSAENGPPVEDTTPEEAKGPSDDAGFIPSSLPKEIQVMIDAYLFGRPLTLIASREHLISNWSLLLPEEFGYVMMGYFKIIGVQETRMESPDLPSLPVGLQSTSGYVNWSFHLQWRPGGEEFIMPKVDRQVLEHPWWEPPAETVQAEPLSETMMEIEQQEGTSDAKTSPTTEQARTSTDTMMGIEQKEETSKVNPELEEEFPTTPRYLQARMAHHEYQYRHDHFRELYECLLPSFLLAPFGPLLLDTLLARGWFCQECGKVNYQSMLRHRRCSSPFCKERPPVMEPYALDLFTIRDPQDRLPISFPYNVVPHSLVTDVKSYEGGTKTLSYSLKEAEAPFVYHIFTGNVPLLQEHATTLLEQVQLQVELVRPFNDNTPYFSYVARGPRPKKKNNNIDVPWEDVPACINEAKAILADRAGKFTGVKKSRISISQLKLLAWVASGSRNGPETLRATKKCIVLLSFGCDIVLTLTPRFVERSSVKNADNDEKNNGEKNAEHDTNTPDGVTVTEQETVKAPKIKPLKKSEKLSIVLYLVHGDCVVLDGDDFEYSMKRNGTSFLLIASHHKK